MEGHFSPAYCHSACLLYVTSTQRDGAYLMQPVGRGRTCIARPDDDYIHLLGKLLGGTMGPQVRFGGFDPVRLGGILARQDHSGRTMSRVVRLRERELTKG